MKAFRVTGVALVAAMILAACSNAADTPAQANAEPAPIPTEANAATSATFEIDEGSKAMLALLSPEEIAIARFGCITPLESAKANLSLFKSPLAEDIAATPNIPKAAVENIVKQADQAVVAEMMASVPTFTSNSPAPTDDQLTGLKQCLVVAKHYANEQASS